MMASSSLFTMISIPKVFVTLSLVSCVLSEFNLTVLHLNDFHSRFEPTDTYSGACTEQLHSEKKCFGGIARVKAAIDQERAKVANSILVKGGDAFQGTLYYTIHKWKVVSRFLNQLGMTAMALGNHEFDDGPEGLAPFLTSATFPLLAANIDTTKEKLLDGFVKKSVVHTIDGVRIGIVGYITTETPGISSTGKVVFSDEVIAIKEEVARLKKTGINIFIAVGHSGYHRDIEIAEQVPDIDVVVGGHTNTFLYTGKPPSTEEPEGPYPYIAIQKSGRKVPVVQAYAYGKYLGRLHLKFSDDGEVISMEGSPLLLTQELPEDPAIVKEMQEFKEVVESIGNKIVGKTRVFLDGRREKCRQEECSLGNLATDAFIAQFIKNGDSKRWSRVSIALLNGGGVRASIDETAREGNITITDIRTAFPFGNMIDIIEVRGSTIRKLLEQSISFHHNITSEGYGGFLQMSGIHVVFDMSKPVGKRTLDVSVRCLKCRVPQYEPLEEDEIYKIATAAFVAGGGDGYELLRKETISTENSGILDFDAIAEYISSMSPVWIGTEQRIRILNGAGEMTEKPAEVTSGSRNIYCQISSLVVLIILSLKRPLLIF